MSYSEALQFVFDARLIANARNSAAVEYDTDLLHVG
jgi:hypothetical protein